MRVPGAVAGQGGGQGLLLGGLELGRLCTGRQEADHREGRREVPAVHGAQPGASQFGLAEGEVEHRVARRGRVDPDHHLGHGPGPPGALRAGLRPRLPDHHHRDGRAARDRHAHRADQQPLEAAQPA